MSVFGPGEAYSAALDIRLTEAGVPAWIQSIVEGRPPNSECWVIVMPRRSGKTWLANGIKRAREPETTQLVDLRKGVDFARALGLQCLLGVGSAPKPTAGLVLIDEPGIGVSAGSEGRPEKLAAGLVRLSETGTRAVVFATPGEHALLMPHLAADAAKDVVFPPPLSAEEVERMTRRTAWAGEVAEAIAARDPVWLNNPFLLELALHLAEQAAVLRTDVSALLEAAVHAANDKQYLAQVFHNGLNPGQRAELRADRWRIAGVDVPSPPLTTTVAKSNVIADPVVVAHLPDVIRIHHVSDLHHGGTLRSAVDKKDATQAGRRLAQLAGAGSPLESYLNHLEQLAVTGTAPHLLIVTGDLVNRPDPEFGKQAVAWLEKAGSLLAPHSDLRTDDPRILLVGGNHDVAWDLALDARTEARHEWFAQTFANYVHADVHKPVAADRRLFVRYPGIGLRVALLGSAESGGEVARDEDRELMEIESERFASGKGGDVSGLVRKFERLDPGVVNHAIVHRLTPEQGFVTVAALHHQLSPVPSVEIAPYTGIVNSGQTKKALAAARTALVLHGHTHLSFMAAERFLDRSPGWTIRIAGAPTLASASATEQNGYNEVFLAREGGDHAILIRPVRLDGGQWTPADKVAFRAGAPAECTLEDLLADSGDA